MIGTHNPDQLIDGHLDGSLSERETADLVAWLSASADHVRQFADRAALHASMWRSMRRRTGQAGGELRPAHASPTTTAYAARRSRPWAIAAGLLIAATVAVVAATLMGGGSDDPATANPATVAVVTETSKPVWLSELRSPGDAVTGGDVGLASGSAVLDFRDGTTLTLSGPVRFEVTGRSGGRLVHGRLLAEAKPGFTVDTPAGMRVTDLGTSFRLDVADDGRTELIVLDGRVRVEGLGFAAVEATVGRTLAIGDDGALMSDERPAYARWLMHRHAMRDDAALAIAMDLDDPAARSDSPRTRPGRFAGAVARDFAGVGDRVELDGPGACGSFTLAMWVTPDRLSEQFQSLVMTDDWGPGGVHFQLHGDRLNIGFYVTAAEAANVYAGSPLIAERWQHVAATYDGDAGRVRLYLNGQPVADRAVRSNVAPDLSRLGVGAWRPGDYDRSRELDRPLIGGVDELLVLRRAMSDDEIHQLYENGKQD